mmetsp:Transcript_18843/g.47581  ORF Transcript_18843/g.47581 Transcript_18843/m.47581 type:complete len:221 (+) Transcript_18843:1175-1837(+)
MPVLVETVALHLKVQPVVKDPGLFLGEVAGVEHGGGQRGVPDVVLGGGVRVAVHLADPGLGVGGGGVHVAGEIPCIGVCPHILRDGQPIRGHARQVRRRHHDEAPHLVRAPARRPCQAVGARPHVRDVLHGQRVVHTLEVRVQRGHCPPGASANFVRQERPPQQHVRVQHQHVVLLWRGALQPVDDRLWLVVRGVYVAGARVRGKGRRDVRGGKSEVLLG